MRDERSFTLSLEVGPIAESASWAQWEALGVALSRELPARTLTTLAHEVQQRLLGRVRAAVAATAPPGGAVFLSGLRG